MDAVRVCRVEYSIYPAKLLRKTNVITLNGISAWSEINFERLVAAFLRAFIERAETDNR